MSNFRERFLVHRLLLQNRRAKGFSFLVPMLDPSRGQSGSRRILHDGLNCASQVSVMTSVVGSDRIGKVCARPGNACRIYR